MGRGDRAALAWLAAEVGANGGPGLMAGCLALPAQASELNFVVFEGQVTFARKLSQDLLEFGVIEGDAVFALAAMEVMMVLLELVGDIKHVLPDGLKNFGF